jgi:zinc finger MIZ domain-containing protein
MPYQQRITEPIVTGPSSTVLRRTSVSSVASMPLTSESMKRGTPIQSLGIFAGSQIRHAAPNDNHWQTLQRPTSTTHDVGLAGDHLQGQAVNLSPITPDTTPAHDLGALYLSTSPRQSHVNGDAPNKRRQLSRPDCSAPATLDLRCESYLSTLRTRILEYGGFPRLAEGVERPRYMLLLTACRTGDTFYITLHQLFCLWSINKSNAYTILKMDSRIIDASMALLQSILRNNGAMAPNHLEWFSKFPRNPAILLPTDPIYELDVRRTMDFLARICRNWPSLVRTVYQRKYPLLVHEMISLLALTSATLQPVLFTVSRRQLGITDGEFAQRMEELFKMDQRNSSAANMTALTQPDTNRALLIEQYQSMVLQNLSLKSITGQQSGFQPTTASANTGGNLPSQAAPMLLGPTLMHSSPMMQASGNRFTNQQWSSHSTQQSETAGTVSQRAPIQNFHHQVNTPASRAVISIALNPVSQTTQTNYAAQNNVIHGTINPLSRPSPQPFVPYPTAVDAHSASLSQAIQSAALGDLRQDLMDPSRLAALGQPRFDNAQGLGILNFQTIPPSNANALAFPCQTPVSFTQAGNSQASNTQDPVPLNPTRRETSSSIPARDRSARSTTTHPTQNSQIPSFGADDLFFPRPGSLIPQKDYPQDPYDLKSFIMAPHLIHVRSPKRVPRQMTGEQFPNEKHFQYIKSFAVVPTATPRQDALYKLDFFVTDEEFKKISTQRVPLGEHLAVNEYFDGSTRYRLRLCERPREKSTWTESEWVVAQGKWPDSIYIVCNGSAMTLRRKQHHGKDQALELTMDTRHGHNTIAISLPRVSKTVKPANYMIAIEIVETLKKSRVLEMVWSTGCIPFDDTRREIQARIQKSQQSLDDDIAMESTDFPIGMTDPYTSTMFKIPARGTTCAHLECFDLATWLDTRPCKPDCMHGYPKLSDCQTCSKLNIIALEPTVVDAWKCPICGADARPSSLRIDLFLLNVREELNLTGRGSVKTIMVAPDGTWQPKLEAGDSSGDESDDEPIVPKLKATMPNRLKTPAVANVEVIELLDD